MLDWQIFSHVEFVKIELLQPILQFHAKKTMYSWTSFWQSVSKGCFKNL